MRKNMTPESQIIALAKVEGWKYHEPTSETGDIEMWSHPDDPVTVYTEQLPPYLKSLNSIARVEAKLTEEQQIEYVIALLSFIDEQTCDLNPERAYWLLSTMTPTQRAEAILRALNLWEETNEIN